MYKHKDLTGYRFNKWLVLKYGHTNNNGDSYWLCRCDCGIEKEIRRDHLRNGGSKSCGCLQKETLRNRCVTHGHTVNKKVSKTYNAWSSMKKRCTNKNHKQYKDYGGRGITICDRWLDKENGFKNFLEDMGEIPKNKSLDRIDNNQLINGYSPENCKSSTPKEQTDNRRNSLDQNLLFIRKYNNRLSSSLNKLKLNKINFSKNLPYDSKQLCDHLETIRKTQNNSCPMCYVSYDIKPFDIDHIIPTSSAKTIEELLKLFDLKNLSPLCYKCNRWIKRDRIIMYANK